MNFVETDKSGRLAVRALDIVGRQDGKAAAPVLAPDGLVHDLELVRQIRIERDEPLGKIEIIGGLILVIGQNETGVALRRLADHQTIQGSQDKVGGFVVLLTSANQGEIVDRDAVGPVGVEHGRECGAAIGLHGVEQRPAVDPIELAEEFEAGGLLGCHSGAPAVPGGDFSAVCGLL